MNRKYCNGMVHVIKPGDTLYQLSRYYRIPMAMLLRANPYVDVYNLQVGQEICIPMVRPHQGMICMPIPKDEPMPVTAVREEETGEMTEPVQQEMEREMQREMQREIERGEMQSQESKGSQMTESEKEMESSEESQYSGATKESPQEMEKKVYITDGKQSLGEVLMAHETTWEEFVRLNNLDQVALQEDQIIYVAK